MALKYALFDLDGTLTDSMLGITNCAMYALEKFGIYPESREELYPYIGPPLIYSFMTFHGLSSEQAERAVVYYRERYADAGWRENRVFDGIPELLSTLKERGVHLMVATSKPEVYTQRILEYYNLSQYFSFVAGCTLDGQRSAKAEVIAYIRKRYPAINEENTVMVGDRKYDVEGAHSQGLPALGVLFGYGDREEMDAVGADFIAADMAELQKLLVAMI